MEVLLHILVTLGLGMVGVAALKYDSRKRAMEARKWSIK